jgi:hypothetical protein
VVALSSSLRFPTGDSAHKVPRARGGAQRCHTGSRCWDPRSRNVARLSNEKRVSLQATESGLRGLSAVHTLPLPHSSFRSWWARPRTGWPRRPVPSGTEVWSFRSRLKSQLPSP